MTESQHANAVPAWAVTKIRPPAVRDGVIERTRLSRCFDEAIEQREPVMLVSAPAGAGKTSAIASWAQNRDAFDLSWLQLDQADNDPVRFWTTLVAALAANRPTFADRLGPLLSPPNVGFDDSVLPELVNTLDDAGETVIVLDDYHLITNDRIHSQVGALIDVVPPNVLLIVSTRLDPPLRLGRLRVRGQLCEIRAHDLRFDPSEAAPIFAETHVTSPQIELLCQRTEGWAAGLVLAAVSLARSEDPQGFVEHFAGDNSMVVDYLSTELWDNLGESTKQFFLDLSVLDKMCGSLVDAVVGVTGKGAAWLETAARDNQLIIPLDEHGEWYRYHHLLQDLLHHRLVQADPDRAKELRRRAARWFADHGDEGAAIRQALAAEDTAWAADHIGLHGSVAFSDGQLVTVQSWLDALGEETIAGHPRLAVLRVWTQLVDGDHTSVDHPVAIAAELLDSAVEDDEVRLLRGSLAGAAALAATARGDIGAALATIEHVVATPDEHEITPLLTGIHGICLTWRGQHAQAIAPLEATANLAPTTGQHLIAATALEFLGINACAAGDPGRAAHMARQAIAHASAHGLSEYYQLGLANSVLGRTLVPTDPDGALHHGERGLALTRRSHGRVTLAFALISLGEIQLGIGDHEAADVSLTEARLLIERCADPGWVLTLLALTETRAGRRAASPAGSGQAFEDLTERELTVLRLLPSRLSMREIGSELYVSHNTVKGHVKAIYRKLGVDRRSLAVQRARELHLL